MRPATVRVLGREYAALLKVDEYRDAFEPGTGRDALYRAIAAGQIPSIRRGRSIRIVTAEAVRGLGLEVEYREGPDDKNEEPPASDVSKNPNPAEDRTSDQYSTEPTQRSARDLGAVP